MRAMKQPLISRSAIVSSLLICTFLLSTARADILESARMLPDDTVLMISVESVKDLQTALEKTSLYSFYKDPTIQQIVGPAEKKIRDQIDTALKDFWHEAKMENPPEQIPYPEGRLVFGLALVAPPAPAEANAPSSPGADNEDEDKDEEDSDAGVLTRMVLLADLGDRAAQARQVVQAVSANIIGGNGKLEKKELAGIPMDIRMPPAGKEEPMICYGFKDNWLLVTLDETKRLDFTEAIARRVGRTLPDSLGDKPGFRAAIQTLGDAHLFLFLNPDALKAVVAAGSKDKGAVERVIKGLGLANVTSLAVGVRIAGEQSQDVRTRGLIGIRGSPTGLPALLSPASASLKPSDRLVTRDAIGFLCANYEPAKLFDNINKIVQETAYQDLNMIVQAALAATAGDGGQPPVQLREDILAQVGAPLLVTWKVEKPYTPTSHLQFLIALPVRDGPRLDTALGRIHKAFLGADPKSRRELLDHTLYLLPFPGAAAGDRTQMALSVAGDHLVFGAVDDVEQAIRSLQKEPDNALASDPMFRDARERLPSQAGLYYYRNDRLNGEFVWATAKEAIRKWTAQVQDGSKRKDNIPASAKKTLKTLLQALDLSQWPDFKMVEKYWGTTVGFLQNRPEGIYWETTSFKPVQP